MDYSVRRLKENDWRVFSEIRLRALRTDPKVFGSTYEREASFTENEWRSRLKDPNSAIFAVVHGNVPVGIAGVAVDRNDASGKTAVLWGSWLELEVRGRGLSKLLYEIRIDWARKQSGVERIIVSHRESNITSRFANQRFGFVPTHVTNKLWNDGVTEKEFHYELIL